MEWNKEIDKEMGGKSIVPFQHIALECTKYTFSNFDS
jgi:hypothetical protein